MNKVLKPIALVALGVFIIGLIGSAVTSVATGTFNFLSLSTEKISDSATLEGSEFSTIEVNTSIADIIVTPHQSSQIDIYFEGEVSPTYVDDFQLVTEENGSKLKVEVKHKNRNFNFGIFHMKNLKLEIAIPEKQYAQLRLQTATGDIQLEKIKADRLVLSSSTGDLKLRGYEGQELQANTQTGDISIHDVQAEMTMKTSTGDIYLKGVQGHLEARSSTGDVEVWLEKVDKDVIINTSTGDIQVYVSSVPENIRLDLSSSTGDTLANLPNVQISSKGERYLKGEIGTGGPVVEARSSTGDINISVR